MSFPLRPLSDTYLTPDDLYKYLYGLGHRGSLNDMIFAWLNDQGYTSGAINDRLLGQSTIAFSVSIGTGQVITGTELTANVSGLVGGETVTYQWQLDGVDISGETTSTYTPTIGTDSVVDNSLIRCQIMVDGEGPITSGSRTVWTIPATAANGLGPYSFIKDQAISAIDVTADFTLNGNTLTYEDLGLPSGLSLNVSDEIVGTPDTLLGDDDYIIRGTDQHGRQVDSTIGIEVIETGEITLSTATYTRGSAGVSPTLAVTGITTTNTTGPYYLDVLTVTNGTTPSQTDMDNGSGTGVLEKLTLGPQADIANLDGDLDLSVSMTNGRIYIQYRDSAGNLSALTSVATADSITYDAVAPGFSSAVVENVAPSDLVITLDKATYEEGTLAPADFTLGGTYGGSISTATLTNTTTITLGLSTPVANGDTLTVALTDGAVLVGVDAEAVATWTAESVTNNVAGGSTITDDFNRADEDVSANANWSVFLDPSANANDIGVVSNQVAAQTGTPVGAFKHATSIGNSNQYAEIQYISGSGGNNYLSLFVRAADTNNYYELRYTFNGKSLIYKNVAGAGAATFTGSTTGVTTDLVANDVIRFEANGTTLRALRNGTETLSVTDSDLSGDGVGFGRNNDFIVDNFEAGSL